MPAVLPRLVIAGTSSGVGKTTVTVAICRALRARGLKVALFKCGPDYLDPTYHRRAAGRPAQTLDSWMMSRDAVVSTFVRAAEGADLALIEGMMGLFDGESPVDERGSTAEIAKWLQAPVLLIVDAGGVARSIAAMVGGFAGFLRSDPALSFPERHLGLRTADDRAVPEALFERWAAEAEQGIELDALLSAARSAPALAASPGAPRARVGRPSCRIGVAFDDAFHFYYEENLGLLEQAGAQLVRFSPLEAQDLPDVEGLYIGGGYPEVFAQRLADNRRMREAIRAFAGRGGVVYAECGGLMYLSDGIQTLDGARHPMVSLIPRVTVLSPRLEAIGYVEVETRLPTVLGPAGVSFRGHQFRYSPLETAGGDTSSDPALAYSVRSRGISSSIDEGFVRGNVLASYVHAHWASTPAIASHFVDACARELPASTL